ncbi:hypothetical protein ABEB36_009671 [Hypothenemus hampei]|uniref:cyclin-dependent kinase n=1 Tax=Hypothenemus hampei TaxID=57062 RepID=A0ABD1EH19_HYPHA
MEKYEQISVVGEGSYGLVMKCRHKETDQIVAVKKFLETEEDPTIRKLALREIRMLKRLKHENLVTMIEVFRHRKRFYIVFEFMEGTVLDELEKMPGGLGEERSRERIYQVCRAISYCHNNHIIHRDVKPENVLVSSLGVVKLCDFGFARIVSINGEACTEYVATRWYRAPELLVGEPIYGAPVDIWAIGCLFAEMITGDPVFPGKGHLKKFPDCGILYLGKPCIRHQQLMTKNSQLKPMIKTPSHDTMGFYKVFPTWPLTSIDFLNCCTKMDPQDRLTADELLKHTYFLHDKFPQRFLPALREKVGMEFNTPLLRKLKPEILVSTEKKEENKIKKLSNDVKWKFNLTEGTVKRKYGNDNLMEPSSIDKNLISLSRSSQRLSLLNNINNNVKIVQKPKVNIIQTSNKDIQALEKSLENVVRMEHYDENRPMSDHNKDFTPILPETPTFHTFHFGIGDHQKTQNVLHPKISNISFNRELPRKSPLNNNQGYKVPNIMNSRSHFLKKLERNLVMENIFGQGDHSNINSNSTPHWLNSFALNKRKRELPNKNKNDDFSLPNLPGVATPPDKTKKKNSIPELELPDSNEVSPAYRYKKAKRKRNVLDISLTMPVKDRSRFYYKYFK